MANKLEWNALPRKEQTHSPDWYWAVSIIAVAIIVASVILHNVLFAIFILVSTLVLFLHSFQKPKVERFELTVKGLHRGREFTPFSSLQSFFVEEEPEPKLLLKSKQMLTPLLVIPLGSINPDTVREHVGQYLYEETLEEPFSRKFMEMLGF